MDNILSYLKWRGDISFSKSPFNEVDNLILSMLCYLPLEEVVPSPGKRSVLLIKAAESYFSVHPMPETHRKAVHSEDAYEWLLYQLAASERFRMLRLSDMVSITDESGSEQFAALCVHIDRKNTYIAFRGTADTLIGWKEDFLLSCLSTIPSQRHALQYLTETAGRYPGRVFAVGGHSKGGNLAVYAAAKVPASIQKRISSIWSNDGPGFQKSFPESRGYKRIRDRIRSIVPESSVVGMLLSHDNSYEIVSSSQIGLMQHDGFSWEVEGTRFVQKEGLSGQSILMDMKIRDWLDSIPDKEKRKTIDILFDLLSASGAATLTEVRKGKLKVAISALPQMLELPKETRDIIIEFLILVEQLSLRLSVESRLNKALRTEEGS